jgi:hypothetical protein
MKTNREKELVDIILSHPGSIIVGVKVAELIKNYYPDIEISSYTDFNKSKITQADVLEDSEIMFTYKEPDILGDIENFKNELLG